MRPSLLRARRRLGLPARIACMCYPKAMMPMHAAKAGFDAIWRSPGAARLAEPSKSLTSSARAAASSRTGATSVPS